MSMRFQLGRELGKGTYGQVYQAILDGTVCAVKVMKVEENFDAILREIMFSQAVVSPYVNSLHVALLDTAGGNGTVAYLFYELMDGDLNSLPNEKIDIPDMTWQLLQGVDAIHRAGWVHSDIKFDNILWKRQGERILYRLCDFSISHIPWQEKGDSTFPSPSLIESGFASQWSDLWALGKVVYMTMTGEDFTCLGWGSHHNAEKRYKREMISRGTADCEYAGKLDAYNGNLALVRSHYILQSVSQVRLDGHFGGTILQMLKEKRIPASQYLALPLFSTFQPPGVGADQGSSTGVGADQGSSTGVGADQGSSTRVGADQGSSTGVGAGLEDPQFEPVGESTACQEATVIFDILGSQSPPAPSPPPPGFPPSTSGDRVRELVEGIITAPSDAKRYLMALKMIHLIATDPLLKGGRARALSRNVSVNLDAIQLLVHYNGNVNCFSRPDEGRSP